MKNSRESPDVWFLCGSHSSGKTTMLSLLLSEGILNERGTEIGVELFYQRQLDTASQDERFEAEVTDLELARDNVYANYTGVIGIESWHPGNLAYAMVRNPSFVPDLIQRMATSPLLCRAHGIWLRIPPQTISMRTQKFQDRKEWAMEFYKQIDENIPLALEKLDLLDRTFLINANRPVNLVLTDIKEIICNTQQRNTLL